MKTAKIALLGAILSLALSTTAFAALDTSCMVTAVDKREDAIISAWDTYAANYKAALETRQTALLAAWTDTNKATRRAAVRNAWRNFRKSRRATWRTRRSAILSAWRQFKTDRIACGAQSADESGTQSEDLNVQQ